MSLVLGMWPRKLQQPRKLQKPCLEVEKKSLFADGPVEYPELDATLILAPSHLIGQWQDEFKKLHGVENVHIIVLRVRA